MKHILWKEYWYDSTCNEFLFEDPCQVLFSGVTELGPLDITHFEEDAALDRTVSCVGSKNYVRRSSTACGLPLHRDPRGRGTPGFLPVRISVFVQKHPYIAQLSLSVFHDSLPLIQNRALLCTRSPKEQKEETVAKAE